VSSANEEFLLTFGSIFYVNGWVKVPKCQPPSDEQKSVQPVLCSFVAAHVKKRFLTIFYFNISRCRKLGI